MAPIVLHLTADGGITQSLSLPFRDSLGRTSLLLEALCEEQGDDDSDEITVPIPFPSPTYARCGDHATGDEEGTKYRYNTVDVRESLATQTRRQAVELTSCYIHHYAVTDNDRCVAPWHLPRPIATLCDLDRSMTEFEWHVVIACLRTETQPVTSTAASTAQKTDCDENMLGKSDQVLGPEGSPAVPIVDGGVARAVLDAAAFLQAPGLGLLAGVALRLLGMSAQDDHTRSVLTTIVTSASNRFNETNGDISCPGPQSERTFFNSVEASLGSDPGISHHELTRRIFKHGFGDPADVPACSPAEFPEVAVLTVTNDRTKLHGGVSPAEESEFEHVGEGGEGAEDNDARDSIAVRTWQRPLTPTPGQTFEVSVRAGSTSAALPHIVSFLTSSVRYGVVCVRWHRNLVGAAEIQTFSSAVASVKRSKLSTAAGSAAQNFRDNGQSRHIGETQNHSVDDCTSDDDPSARHMADDVADLFDDVMPASTDEAPQAPKQDQAHKYQPTEEHENQQAGDLVATSRARVAEPVVIPREEPKHVKPENPTRDVRWIVTGVGVLSSVADLEALSKIADETFFSSGLDCAGLMITISNLLSFDTLPQSAFASWNVGGVDLSSAKSMKLLPAKVLSNLTADCLVLPPNVEAIGEFAFERSTLKNAPQLQTLCSLRELGKSAFASFSIDAHSAHHDPESAAEVTPADKSTNMEDDERNVEGVTTENDEDAISFLALVFPPSMTAVGEWCFNLCDAAVDLSRCTALTEIAPHCFQKFKGPALTLPPTIDSIGMNCFLGCSSVDRVDLSSCLSLTSLPTSCFDRFTGSSICLPPTIATLGARVFSYCTASVDLSHCSDLQSLPIDGFGFFSGAEVYLPAGLTSLGDRAFWGASTPMIDLQHCHHLTELGGLCFAACAATTLTLPASISSVGSGAFRQCSTSVDLSACLALEHLPDSCFCQFQGPTLALPSSVKMVEVRCFGSCRADVDLSKNTALVVEDVARCFPNFLGTLRLPPSLDETNAHH